MCSGKLTLSLSEGKNLFVGGKEVELECSISRGEFLTGACFGNGLTLNTQKNSVSIPTKKFNPPSLNSTHSHGLGSPNLKPEKDQILCPSDITNCPLYWTANWFAFTIDSKSLYSSTN